MTSHGWVHPYALFETRSCAVRARWEHWLPVSTFLEGAHVRAGRDAVAPRPHVLKIDCRAPHAAALLAPDMVSFLRYWLPLLIWMSVIFSASSDAKSTQRSSRLLGPLLHWLWPEMPPEKIESVRYAARKAAHVTEFAILAWLWWRALRRPVRGDARPWSWRLVGFALLAVVLYAATDEWHQCFVPNRTGAVRDVFIDTAGGVLGLGLVWLLHLRSKDKSVSIAE